MANPMHPDMKSLEAAVFRRLIRHLQLRDDVTNADLMATAGFCRNCLAEWLVDASVDTPTPLTQAETRRYVYGGSYADYKARQPEVTPAQQQQIDASIERNVALGEQGARGAMSELDDELAGTFPASDPTGVGTPSPT